MAYLHNNKKVKKERDIQIIKRNMKLKLELVQEQLSGTKFGQIAGGGVGDSSVLPPHINPHVNPLLHNDSSLDSEEGIANAPFLRKAVSSYDPELVKKEELLLRKKRLELEKNIKNMELFQEFSESEQLELSKLDTLTRIYLFLRKKITNPIMSLDEIDIKHAVEDFTKGALHCQNRIERIGKKTIKSAREKKVLKGLTERKTILFNIFSTFIY